MRKLAQDCIKYGEANRTIHPVLAGASSYFGTSFISIEKEKEILLKTLSDQVISWSTLDISNDYCLFMNQENQKFEINVFLFQNNISIFNPVYRILYS